MAIPKPSWFSAENVLVSTAPTCGLTKGGRLLPLVDSTSGKRIQREDPETHEMVDAVDDRLLLDMEALAQQRTTSTLRFIPNDSVTLSNAVPIYYDRTFHEDFKLAMTEDRFVGFTSGSLGRLQESKLIEIKYGHGSPSADERVGDVPYIKVSDLRAGLVNINPTNRVLLSVAERFWKAKGSGLKPYDLICPERTSKNIGDFCVLMPGQERVVLTKEVIILRPGPRAPFDAFYLLWAMTLNIVRNQWRRVVFMQTNREDVGDRFLEIELPVPRTRADADRVSAEFRRYYEALATARHTFGQYLDESRDHHFFVAGSGSD